MSGDMVLKSYAVSTPKDQRATCDARAAKSEQDLCAMGYRPPALAAGAFARLLPPETGPVLDAGRGGGIQAEALALSGYGPLIGLDLSEGMLEAARARGIYAERRQGALGAELDLPEGGMDAVLCIGTITPNDAPPESFDGLIRAARPGAPIVFSLRDDPAQDPADPERVAALTKAGASRQVWSSASRRSIPYGAEEITHRLHAHRKTAA